MHREGADKLVLDFDRFSINGIAIGEIISKNIDLDDFDNKERGFSVTLKDSVVTGFFCCICQGCCGYQKFPGRFFKNSTILELNCKSKLDEIIETFGVPDRQWNDGSEINVQFLFEERYRVEFAWQIRSVGSELDYVIVELD
jgi:hypothetical protein